MRFLLIPVLLCVLMTAAEDARLKSFHAGLAEYVKARKAALEGVPSVGKKAEPAEIDRHERTFGEAIQKARPNARQGDVFTAEARPLLFAILKSHLAGSTNKDGRATIKEGNPKHEKEPGEAMPVIRVNAIYPQSASLSSVPPLLLQQLPKLPEEIEYRFVGRTLVLFDARSNIIIDYLKEAAPAL